MPLRALLPALVSIAAACAAPVVATTSPSVSATVAAANASATASASATVAVSSILPSATPEATRTPADPSWSQLRRELPAGVPIIEPTWMPAMYSGVRAQMSMATTANASETTYTVTYRTDRDTVTFSLGGPGPSSLNTSGVGMIVRHSRAQLRFPFELLSGGVGLRVVSWSEGSYALRIESQTISGDDLLHIAWSLDLTGAPGPFPARANPGACADAISPETTARHLIALIGGHDRDALTDCLASEAVGSAGPWADLPSATLDSIRLIQGTGGRRQYQVSWLFTSDPGGAWNRLPTNFFLMGREDGVWRVFAVNTGPFPNSP